MAQQSHEQVHLKVLQTVVTLVSSMSAGLEEDSVSRALCICLMLHKASTNVTNIAAASLRQMVSMIFDRAKEGQEICTKLLRDLCSLACGEAAVWLKVRFREWLQTLTLCRWAR